jgi:hypothetical protein
MDTVIFVFPAFNLYRRAARKDNRLTVWLAVNGWRFTNFLVGREQLDAVMGVKQKAKWSLCSANTSFV